MAESPRCNPSRITEALKVDDFAPSISAALDKASPKVIEKAFPKTGHCHIVDPPMGNKTEIKKVDVSICKYIRSARAIRIMNNMADKYVYCLHI